MEQEEEREIQQRELAMASRRCKLDPGFERHPISKFDLLIAEKNTTALST